MHNEALEWVRRHATTEPVTVLDLGGRNINGSCRELFPNATVYVALDIADGPGVDIVADAATWTPDREYDYVISTECFEHCREWPAVVTTAYKALKPGGTFVATMAGPGRAEHSGVDGGAALHPGEWYQNIGPGELLDVLNAAGFVEVTVDQQPSPADVRAVATK